jgi:hypothetical protein
VYHVFFVNAIAVCVLDLHPDSLQFHQLKIYFKGISVTLVHQKGVKKIRGLVASAGNFRFKNTTVKVGFDMTHIYNLLASLISNQDHALDLHPDLPQF